MNTHRPTPDHDPADVAGIAPAGGTAERLSPGIGTADAATALLRRADEQTDAVRPATVVPIAPRRRRTRRALASLAVASVLGLAVAGVTVVLPADSPAGPSAAVAAEIEKLVLRAGETPADAFGAGDFLHVVDISQQSDLKGSGSPDQATERESWFDGDGASWVRQSYSGGSTELWHFPSYGPEGSVNGPTPTFLASLPTEREALREYLDENVEGSTSHDEAVFVAVGDLLRPGYGSPKLRAAALGVLTTLPGVDVRHDVLLPSGRAGTGLVWKRPTGDGPRSVSTLIVDPATSRVLGEHSGSAATMSSGGETEPLGYWSERVTSKVVGAVPAEIRRDAVTQPG